MASRPDVRWVWTEAVCRWAGSPSAQAGPPVQRNLAPTCRNAWGYGRPHLRIKVLPQLGSYSLLERYRRTHYSGAG